ncbi:unnamed protein product [Protopolystoma xenopodis]|uniref:Uncharacterized protein n=1 Tax=Protopolystoma xenopodis TaxID=117903 RepID=A0A3S5CQT0_9PLAT|nr:unnamed protein product [Protopolystoma xenopodis]
MDFQNPSIAFVIQRPSCTGRTLSNSGMAGSSLAGQQKRARYPVIDDSDADWTTGSGANSRSVVGSCGSVARRGQSSSQTFVGQDEEIRSTSAGLVMHRVAEHHLGQPPAQRRMQQQQLKHAYLPPHPAPSQQATSGQTQLQNHRGLQVQQQVKFLVYVLQT